MPRPHPQPYALTAVAPWLVWFLGSELKSADSACSSCPHQQVLMGELRVGSVLIGQYSL